SLLWDKVTGKPVYNALVWHDMRTADIVYELLEGHDINRFRATTGLPLATYFSAVKIMWLLRNVPGLRANAEAGNVLFGTIDTWLLWKLSGGAVHATDVSNASRTNLMDLSTLDWSEGASLGRCFKPGEAKNTYGTGCFFMMNTGTDAISSTKGLLTTVGYKLGNEPCVYALEGSVAVAGKVVQWLRDNMKIITKPSDIEGLALAVPDNGGCYFVPAFSGLYAPYWRSDARGVICGLTGFVTREHLARASLEAVAFQVMDVVHAMQDEAKIELSSLRVDGGMIENDLLMQIQVEESFFWLRGGMSDVEGRCRRTYSIPTSCAPLWPRRRRWAAFAAGLAVGVWMNTDDLVKTWHVAKVWRSNMQHDARAKLTSEWKKAIARTLNWTE
ncbi:hypothetical protein DYB32_009633, partial [Aphanomyces invadans]